MGFYDNEYWQDGEGQRLWNVRKVSAVLNAMTPEGFTPPDLTWDAHDGGTTIYAEWNTPEKAYSCLQVEAEGSELWIFAFDPESNYVFCYAFGLKPSEEGYTPWDKLEEAIAAGRNWLEERREFFTVTRKDWAQLMNFPES